MDKKINKLKYGSIIPDLKYRLGKNPAMKIIDHIHPKVGFFNRVPILNKIIGIIIDNRALGNLAAKLVIPNILKEIVWIQKNKGGFSWKGSKLIITWEKLFNNNISREDSAKLISSQSNKLKSPIVENIKIHA